MVKKGRQKGAAKRGEGAKKGEEGGQKKGGWTGRRSTSLKQRPNEVFRFAVFKSKSNLSLRFNGLDSETPKNHTLISLTQKCF